LATPANSEETVTFYRHRELPGVELRTVRNSGRTFCSYATDFEFAAPSTWRGEVWHRRQRGTLEPGSLLCVHPGDVIEARKVLRPGSGSALTIESDALSSYLAEHGVLERSVNFKPFVRMSSCIRDRLAEVFHVFRHGFMPMAVESAMVAFVAVAVDELLAEPPRPSAREADALAAERVRDCLQDDPSATTDLSTLAQRTGMSRFRVLRVFKRHFGLPPHAYQLRVRLGLAQKALRAGAQPAEVAADLGFVDQSHMTRHFRRLLGVTPAQYARLGTWGQPRRAAPQFEAKVA
jgi:AraC-like DNA-binding protein